MLDVLWAIGSFAFAITLLIGIHEYGHFIVARKLGVKVLRYAIGFGPVLWRRKDSFGADYTLGLLPLGGYVKMLDEREGPVDPADYAVCFNRQPLWKRTCIVAAGPVFNFLFAIVAYWLFFVVGQPAAAPIIGQVAPNSIAAQAQLRPRQEILSINGRRTKSWRQVNMALLTHAGESSVRLKVQNPGANTSEHQLSLKHWQLSHVRPDPVKTIGVEPFVPSIPPVIAKVAPGSAAEQAGLKVGDRFIAINRQPVTDWMQVAEPVRRSANQPLPVTVQRGNRQLRLVLTPKPKQRRGQTIGMIGVQSAKVNWPNHLTHRDAYAFFAAGRQALVKTWHMVGFSFTVIKKMLLGDLSVRSLSGPVGIAQGAGASASYSWLAYVNFLALVSVSLGVLNILPIPILDGGHLFYYLIEALRGGKPVPMAVQQAATQVGLLLILLLMGVALYNDIVRLL